MKFGSLFDGIYGFGLGLERTGLECAWRSEINKDCNALMDARRPNILNLGDVRNVGKHNAKPVDVICGGFPCQDLSVAGKRAGLAGERSGLWFEFHRVIAELEPRTVVIENVPGLLSSDGGRDFAVILRGLVELGYGVAWRVLDARYFGVAQRRRRVFVVASLGDGRAAEILFESEGLPRDSTESGEAREGIAPIAGTLSANRGGLDRPAGNANELDFCIPMDVRNLKDNGEVSGTLQSKKTGGYSLNYQNPVAVGKALMAKNQRNDFETENLIAFNIQHNDGGEHKRKDRPNGGLYVNETDTALTVGTTDLTAIAWHENKGGSFTADNTTKALRAGASHSYQGIGVRRLTPTECERLQGFPDGWTAGFADSTRYRMLGNAVCVNVAEWIGKRLM